MAFESVTDNKITELLTIPKKVTNPSVRAKLKDGHEQYNYSVVCIENEKLGFKCHIHKTTEKYIIPKNPN